MSLNSPISELKGVGDELAEKLGLLGVKTIGDLIENYPRRYVDYSNVVPLEQIRPGVVSIRAKISQVKGRYVRRGMHITEAIASDETGSVRLVWFNQPYRADATKHAQAYYISGPYALRRGRFSIANPSVELISDFPINTARIIPIYREVRGLKSFQIRKLVRSAADIVKDMPEHLPSWLLEQEKLIDYKTAALQMHFPSSAEDLEKAQRRLGFEEVFQLSLAALLNKSELYKDKSIAIPFKEQLAKEFVSKLPFKLTDAQRRAVWKIYQDMDKTQPMNRLLEGDVGSGKTVVAAMAALMAMEQGFQAALMAPTEILARQHADTLYKLLETVGYDGQVGLLIGGLKPKEKQLARDKIASGDIKFIVGTHALISERVDMHKLGLVIIDEQHRFGVAQRKKLQAKAGHMPHVLHMSATPIPRSIALTLYGELDISILDELPPGRRPVATKICSPNSRAQLNAQIDKQLAAGRQMFIVCPLITDSETSRGLSAEEVYERVSNKEFRDRRIALLHGQLKSAQKDEIMQAFLNHRYDILVSTTVIEVGIDVPNASIMLVEGAERFGLAQIHQLRGRVGRGAHQSYCFLMLSDSKAPSQRLRALEDTTDGFKLAELDLELRGPGAIYGTMQHGALDLRVAKLTDTKLIATARNAAQMFIDKKENLKKYPHLAQKVSTLRAITNLN
ncbi:MAG TPA: ATP-dependent DNA helicase RecG [Candidatus Saccharimonadales bacterium]|nr:ATP-dependent DNA helicase RecG [Candidatus Saccharimonadales bacterium]